MDSMPTVLIIVGISGDLSKRKLLPAIEQIAKAGQLPANFHVIGVTRQTNLNLKSIVPEDDIYVHGHTSLFSMDLDLEEDYKRLGQHINEVESKFGSSAQRLYYLSVPPNVSRSIVQLLGRSGLASGDQVKLLLEKPFGTDLASAEELIKSTNQLFSEEQIYRIDHYLAKEMVQNLLVFRSGNSLFKRTWNNDFIDRIEIVMSQDIDIENRSVFYEQTGALRDIVQSHLLQLAAITLMDLPASGQLDQVPLKRLEALEALMPADSSSCVRGQYAGYRDEVGKQDSTTETFVSLRLNSSSSRWRNVPIMLATGKALDCHTTEIRIHYKRDEISEADQLTLHIQPREGAALNLWAKKPGYDRQLEGVKLAFDYNDSTSALPDAYERVLLDAMRSDHTLFASSAEVLASWKILKPLQEQWQEASDDIVFYPKGSKLEDIITSKP